MSMLQEIREMFKSGEMRKGKTDGMLYLSARMHDAETEAKDHMKLAYATEKAAIDIIRRFDSDGSLVREFKAKIESHRSRL